MKTVMLPCHRCTHLCIEAREVHDLPKIVPGHVRRASDMIERLFGAGYRIVRKDVYCRKRMLPTAKYPIHRALGLEVQKCEAADIDWTQPNAYYTSKLPSVPAYWINGKMIAREKLDPALRRILQMPVTERVKIMHVLRNAGVSISERKKSQ